MEFSNSDVKDGDIIGIVQLIDELVEDIHSSTSSARIQGQSQPLADQNNVEARNADRKSRLKQQLKLPELQADLTKAGTGTDQVKEIEKVLLKCR